MGSSLLAPFAIPIAIGLCNVLLRYYFPPRPNDPDEPPLTEDERRYYGRRYVGWGLPAIFFFVPLLGFLSYLALKGLAGLFHQATPTTRFAIFPEPIYWALPAGFIGIVSSAIPTGWLFQVLLRDRCRRFERYCREREGCEGGPALLMFSVLVVIGSAIGFVAGVTTFARFEQDGMEIGRTFELRSTRYGYERVAAIEHRTTFLARDGSRISRPHHVIRFDDGSSWSTREFLRVPLPGPDGQLAEFVAQRSGKPITECP